MVLLRTAPLLLAVSSLVGVAEAFVAPRRAPRAPAAFATAVDSVMGTEQVYEYHLLDVPTEASYQVIDMTAKLQDLVDEAGITEGAVNVMSKHTTTAVTINEYEHNLKTDLREALQKIAPPGAGYLHDNIQDRPSTPEDAARVEKNWKGTVQEWRDQEPINTHSHLYAMLLGASEVVPVTEGKLAMGTWQSLMFVELDGPRADRKLAVQVTGLRPKA